jgi:hypothetical protein
MVKVDVKSQTQQIFEDGGSILKLVGNLKLYDKNQNDRMMMYLF